MRVHVTGGAGFLGGFIAPALRRAHEVEISDRGSLDVTDAAAVVSAFERTRPDLVVHLAAVCGARQSLERPAEFHRTNAQGTVHVLEACRRAGVPRLVLASSLTVHGSGEEAKTERSPHAPRHPYAASKVAAEVMTESYARCYGLRTLILRPTLVVGVGYKEPHAMGEFVAIARRGEVIEIFGSGDHVRDFVHPADVADAVAAAVGLLEHAPSGTCERVNLGNGQPITMNDLARLVIRLAGRGALRYGPVSAQTFCLFTSIDRARALLGYRPRFGVEAMVRSLVDLPEEPT